MLNPGVRTPSDGVDHSNALDAESDLENLRKRRGRVLDPLTSRLQVGTYERCDYLAVPDGEVYRFDGLPEANSHADGVQPRCVDQQLPGVRVQVMYPPQLVE